MHTLNETGLAQTTKPHQKGLTTPPPTTPKGANNPVNPEKWANSPNTKKGTKSPQHLKISMADPQAQRGGKHNTKSEKGLRRPLS